MISNPSTDTSRSEAPAPVSVITGVASARTFSKATGTPSGFEIATRNTPGTEG